MDALKELDRVAYLRFASVYKDFQETDDFRKFIDKNLNLKNEQDVDLDIKYIKIAIFLLKKIIGTTFPNPPVVSLIVESNSKKNFNKIVSFGYTFEGGRPHAEAVALSLIHI